MKPLRELFGFCKHNWTKWSKPFKQVWRTDRFFDNYSYTYIKFAQNRYCKKCNKQQIIKVKQ